MITTILRNMGLVASKHDPCLFSGIISDPESSIPLTTERTSLDVGLYMDDVVFYSTSSAEDDLFQRMLAKHIQVDFMGDVEYFLGTAFTFLRHFDGNLSVYLSQSALTEFTAHRFGVDKMNKTPNMTPYQSGYPIDSIPEADPDDPDLARCTKV